MHRFQTERTDGWREDGEVSIHLKRPSLARGGGPPHHLSATNNAEEDSPRKSQAHSQLASREPHNSDEGIAGEGGSTITAQFLFTYEI